MGERLTMRLCIEPLCDPGTKFFACRVVVLNSGCTESWEFPNTRRPRPTPRDADSAGPGEAWAGQVCKAPQAMWHSPQILPNNPTRTVPNLQMRESRHREAQRAREHTAIASQDWRFKASFVRCQELSLPLLLSSHVTSAQGWPTPGSRP